MVRLAVVVIVAVGVMSSCGGDGDASESRQPAGDVVTITTTALRDAHVMCDDFGELADDDHTMFIDLGGTDTDSGYITRGFDDVRCVLDQLGAPTSVEYLMRETRALDGRVSDSWADFEASWSYHPDSGLDVLLTEVGPSE